MAALLFVLPRSTRRFMRKSPASRYSPFRSILSSVMAASFHSVTRRFLVLAPIPRRCSPNTYSTIRSRASALRPRSLRIAGTGHQRAGAARSRPYAADDDPRCVADAGRTRQQARLADRRRGRAAGRDHGTRCWADSISTSAEESATPIAWRCSRCFSLPREDWCIPLLVTRCRPCATIACERWESVSTSTSVLPWRTPCRRHSPVSPAHSSRKRPDLHRSICSISIAPPTCCSFS